MGSLQEDLKKQVARGRVVAIVGAGVSIWTTLRDGTMPPQASWIGLLRHGIERVVELGEPEEGWAKRVRADVDSYEGERLVSAGQAVVTALGGASSGEFRRWLEDTVGALRPVRTELIEAIGRCAELVATTNYDNLLTDVLGRPPVPWTDKHEAEEVLAGQPGILHLHGHWKTPRSIVIGVDSYEQITNDDFTQTLMRALRLGRTPVLIGFGAGLEDPNFGPFLTWISEVMKESKYRTYRLVKADELEQARKTSPPGIVCEVYGEDFDDLVPYLKTVEDLRPSSWTPPPIVRSTPLWLTFLLWGVLAIWVVLSGLNVAGVFDREPHDSGPGQATTDAAASGGLGKREAPTTSEQGPPPTTVTAGPDLSTSSGRTSTSSSDGGKTTTTDEGGDDDEVRRDVPREEVDPTPNKTKCSPGLIQEVKAEVRGTWGASGSTAVMAGEPTPNTFRVDVSRGGDLSVHNRNAVPKSWLDHVAGRPAVTGPGKPGCFVNLKGLHL